MTHDSAGRRHTDVYPVALATAAVLSLMVTLTILFTAPRWQTPVFDMPLGSYLMGGAGGMLTVVLSPAWARRLGSRHRRRVVGFTCYRLACAMALGAAAYFGAEALAQSLVFPVWFPYLLALGAGLLEAFVNEAVLRGLGFLAPREIDPRLL